MKKAVIVAVGKVKEGFIRDGIAEYSKRLQRFCDFSVSECEESKREDITAESAAILRHMESGYNIVADLSGENVTSEQLARIIQNAYLSHDKVNLVIGGSRGVTEQVRGKADKVIAFGKATFPHMLFRLMLCEQLYRAFTINAGLPYHK